MIRLNSTPERAKLHKVNQVDRCAIFDTHSSITFSNLEIKRLIQHVKETRKEVTIWLDVDGVGTSAKVGMYELEKLYERYGGDFLLDHVSIDSDRVTLFSVR